MIAELRVSLLPRNCFLQHNLAGRLSLTYPDLHYEATMALEYLTRYSKLYDELKALFPHLYGDLPARAIPENPKVDGEGKIAGHIAGHYLKTVLDDINYILEVRANSKIGQVIDELPRRVFISHGRCHDWLKVQAYILKDVHIDTLELAQEANRGRTVLQKLNEEAAKCLYAVIVMTGEDEAGEGERPRARENVMHEIGFFQGKYGLENVCLLYEEGTNIPSNIHGLVYIPYPKGYVDATFGALRRELEAAFSERKS